MCSLSKDRVSKATKYSELARHLREHGLTIEQLSQEISDAIKAMGSNEEVQGALGTFLIKEGFVKGKPSVCTSLPSKAEKKKAAKEKD